MPGAPVVAFPDILVRLSRRQAFGSSPYRPSSSMSGAGTSSRSQVVFRGQERCRIKGAAQQTAPERPVITLVEVFAIAAHIQPRYRALVLFAAFGQLRFGE